MTTSKSAGALRAVTTPALLAGAAGSTGLMLWAGRHNNSLLLLLLFTIWVISPFAALMWASVVSKRWSIHTQTALDIVILVISLSSLAIYGYRVWMPPKAQGAFVFVLVPPVSWLLMAVVIPAAALASRRNSRRVDGA